MYYLGLLSTVPIIAFLLDSVDQRSISLQFSALLIRFVLPLLLTFLQSPALLFWFLQLKFQFVVLLLQQSILLSQTSQLLHQFSMSMCLIPRLCMADLGKQFLPLVQFTHLVDVVPTSLQKYLISSCMLRQCLTKLRWSRSNSNNMPLVDRFSLPEWAALR